MQVLAHLVQSHMDTSDITPDPDAPLNYTALATQTEGYSVTDLKDLVARAVHRAAIRSSQLASSVSSDDQEVRPLPMSPSRLFSPSRSLPPRLNPR